MLTYEQASDTIEEIIKIKAHLWQKSYISRDDIAQELRLKCWYLLEKYDPARGKSLKSFLNSCTQNFLRNLIRDSFSKFDPPCKKECTHYEANGVPTKDSIFCPRYTKYLAYYNTKTSLRCPINTRYNFRYK
jgi:DNA-directed RNA polymerase specialized sigma24 family protein